MRRRDFIAGLGAVGEWPLVARAQQRAQPIIGYLFSGTRTEDPLPILRQSLKDSGYIEGQNVAIEYRFADWQLPALAADLVRRQATVIIAVDLRSAVTAKAATATIPIVFEFAGDPVELGIVASLNRPGANVTGVSSLNVEIAPKQIEAVHEVVPTATDIGLLVNIRPIHFSPSARRGTCRPRPASLGCAFMFSMPAPSATSIRCLQLWFNSGQVRS